MTATLPTAPRRCRASHGFVLAAAILLAFWVAPHPASAAPIRGSKAEAAGAVKFDQSAWAKSALIFLSISAVGAYLWYFGLFKWLLRKDNPSWPLDAWRLSTYATWWTICLATLAFRPLIVSAVKPRLSMMGSPQPLIDWFMEIVIIPLLGLVGWLVIFNYRRDVLRRSRA